MAIRYVQAVFRLPNITATECLILAYLANRANEHGLCWPTRSTISEACHLHAETVKAQLAGLADESRDGGPLISKVNRMDGGRIVSADVRLLFPPVVHDAHGSGVVAPDQGGSGLPTKPKTSKAKTPQGGEPTIPGIGGSTTPEIESSVDRSEESSRTPQTPKGASDLSKALVGQIMATAERIKALTPGRQGRRNTVLEIAEAIIRARGNGEKDLALMEAGLTAYFDDPERARDKWRFASAAVVMINGAKWREYLPEGAIAARAGPAAANDHRAAAPVEPVRMEVQRAWMRDWVEWGDAAEGNWLFRRPAEPMPGQPGCRVSGAVQLMYGVEPYAEPVGAQA